MRHLTRDPGLPGVITLAATGVLTVVAGAVHIAWLVNHWLSEHGDAR